ncbi:tigger transposable element-derived protein 6-like [Ixodes scapularis]
METIRRVAGRVREQNRNIVGEAASVDDTVLQAWLDKHLDRIFAPYADCDIYNADETGLCFQLLPAKTLASKDDKCLGTKTSKERVTVLLCANMDGSDKRKLLVIGKPNKPRGFAAMFSLPVTYVQNGKAWMTGERFRAWLTDLTTTSRTRNGKFCFC